MGQSAGWMRLCSPKKKTVKPQISCDYIVPIRSVKDGAQNWVDEKDWIEVEHKASQLD